MDINKILIELGESAIYAFSGILIMALCYFFYEKRIS